ncbi:hypothetical protein [Ancylobacter sp.]|uniref:hypothetical protein n=1 Tax=Ancylobacter sp. TaxID=1872567 RepID=UPI003D102329
MTPDAAIGSLNRQLRKHGHDAILRRSTWSGTERADFEVGVRITLRGYRPDEIIGGIMQGDSEVVLAPTQLRAEGWPSGEAELPRQGDTIVSAGRPRSVVGVDPRFIGDTLVRINLQVRG